MLVTASGGQIQNYNEQVATPCGELIKRHTVPVVQDATRLCVSSGH